jgi:hypothetical protein
MSLCLLTEQVIQKKVISSFVFQCYHELYMSEINRSRDPNRDLTTSHLILKGSNLFLHIILNTLWKSYFHKIITINMIFLPIILHTDRKIYFKEMALLEDIIRFYT